MRTSFLENRAHVWVGLNYGKVVKPLQGVDGRKTCPYAANRGGGREDKKYRKDAQFLLLRSPKSQGLTLQWTR
jgi:hypothetical protein